MADVMETSYNQTKTSNEELRAELDKALQSNSELNEQARELNRTLSDRIQQVSLLEDTIEQLNISHQRMQQELGEVEAEKESILSRVQAEIDAGEAAREQADAAARGRDYLDKQVQDLRQAHEDALKYSSQLEEQLGATKSQLSECRGELSDCKEKLLECEGALEAAAGAQAMTTEIEILRAQLNDVRRQLIKRDLEEEAGVMAPSAVMDREQQGRIVYENIISELRGELDRANGKLHEVTRRYEEAQRNAARVEQLEEEVAMYKEMAKNVSRESQT